MITGCKQAEKKKEMGNKMCRGLTDSQVIHVLKGLDLKDERFSCLIGKGNDSMGSFFFQNKYPHPPIIDILCSNHSLKRKLYINMRDGMREREEVGGKRRRGEGERVCV